MTIHEQVAAYTAYHLSQMPRWEIYKACWNSHLLWSSWAALVN